MKETFNDGKERENKNNLLLLLGAISIEFSGSPVTGVTIIIMLIATPTNYKLLMEEVKQILKCQPTPSIIEGDPRKSDKRKYNYCSLLYLFLSHNRSCLGLEYMLYSMWTDYTRQ